VAVVSEVFLLVFKGRSSNGRMLEACDDDRRTLGREGKGRILILESLGAQRKT
jgi:hypothetical protein